MHRPGGAHLLRRDHLTEADGALLDAVARVCHAQRARRPARPGRSHRAVADRRQPRNLRRPRPRAEASAPAEPLPPPALDLPTGMGGFAHGGREYVVTLHGDDETPLPWVNVIANQRFGTIVTSVGAAHTWAVNSREQRLTPFANDPVIDPTAEALFLRDDESGARVVADPGAAAARRPLVRSAARAGRDADHDRTPKASTTASRSSSTPPSR